MTTFERQIIGEIPLHEAASFFVGMKQPVSREAVKTAGARMKSAAQQQIDKLLAGDMPEGKAGQFKPVNQIKEASAPARSAFKRSIELLKGSNAESLASAAKSVSQTQLRAVDPKSTAKKVHDLYRDRLKTAAFKLGFGMNSPAGVGEPEANMEGGQPSPAASNLPALGGASMAPPEGPVQDPVAAKPTTSPTVPVNYMGAELMAQAAQRTNEVGFLRERLNAATEQNNMLNQHVQQIQAQLDEVNQSQQAAGDTIMQATNEAVAASTRALQHSMQAANMRMGIQKMREAMMELASQDPESMGTLAQQQAVQDEAAMEQQAVNAGAGAPGQSATPPTAGGSPAAEAPEQGGSESASGKSESSGGSKGGTSVSIKTGAKLPGGAILPGAVAGAALAGMLGHRQAGKGDEQRAQVQSLEGQQGGSFSKALDLSKAKKQLAETELAEKHPEKYTAFSAVKGGLGGSVVGSAMNHLGQTLKQQGLHPKGLIGKAL